MPNSSFVVGHIHNSTILALCQEMINIIMKITELLYETPLPSEWTDEPFSSKQSFKKRIAYLKNKAKRLGSGSSRIAFEIPYKNRPTVLKIAKNRKGESQNELEASLLSDYYLQSLDLVVPLIDYDTANDKPTWIHVERADKITKDQFKQYWGFDVSEFKDVMNIVTGDVDPDTTHVGKELFSNDDYYETEQYNKLLGLANFGLDNVSMSDLTVINNWGMFNGHPVIIDIGIDSDVFDAHYLPSWS